MQPLTHHEILTLIEPFSRTGRHADLAASDRLARRLVFRPAELAATPGAPVLRETLQLDNPFAGTYRLTRKLVGAAGPDQPLEARLVTEGRDLGELVARVDRSPPAAQFRFGPGFAIARSYALTPDAGKEPQMALTGATAAVGGLSVTFTAPALKGYQTGDIALEPKAGDAMAFPDDLLAVLGRDWGLLTQSRNGFTSSLRLRGREPERSLRAAAKLDQMAEHLARTLAEAPGRFHDRLAGARWRVALHRVTPLLLYASLIVAALVASRLNIQADSPVRLLVFNAAPMLVVLIFSLGKRPRIEIPPIPRRSTAPDWRAPAPPAAAAAAPAPQPLRQG
jgi:hypothetical protein